MYIPDTHFLLTLGFKLPPLWILFEDFPWWGGGSSVLTHCILMKKWKRNRLKLSGILKPSLTHLFPCALSLPPENKLYLRFFVWKSKESSIWVHHLLVGYCQVCPVSNQLFVHWHFVFLFSFSYFLASLLTHFQPIFHGYKKWNIGWKWVKLNQSLFRLFWIEILVWWGQSYPATLKFAI